MLDLVVQQGHAGYDLTLLRAPAIADFLAYASDAVDLLDRVGAENQGPGEILMLDWRNSLCIHPGCIRVCWADIHGCRKGYKTELHRLVDLLHQCCLTCNCVDKL